MWVWDVIRYIGASPYALVCAPVGGFSLTPQKMRIYAKKVNRMLVISKDYRIFANEDCL